MQATAKDLRFHSKKLLDTVARGEEVVITYRGKPCAKLVPYSSIPNTELENGEDTLFGIWKDNEEVADVNKYVRSIREGRTHDH